MSFEVLIARTWIVFAALLVLFITGGGISVFVAFFKRWQRQPNGASFDTHAWTAMVVTVVLDILLFAMLDVGQAFMLLSESWGALVGVCSTLLMPILGYKAVQKVTTSKGGPTDISTGG